MDGNRTAIWGWSYGGYATASALAQDSENVFKCGMSVAPVTNWIYYGTLFLPEICKIKHFINYVPLDSIYTERYMGLPTAEDNLKAYQDGDVCKYPENFRGKQFYLIHGTADDNVHYQQSLMLAKSLEGADVLFRQQVKKPRLFFFLHFELTNYLHYVDRAIQMKTTALTPLRSTFTIHWERSL